MESQIREMEKYLASDDATISGIIGMLRDIKNMEKRLAQMKMFTNDVLVMKLVKSGQYCMLTPNISRISKYEMMNNIK